MTHQLLKNKIDISDFIFIFYFIFEKQTHTHKGERKGFYYRLFRFTSLFTAGSANTDGTACLQRDLDTNDDKQFDQDEVPRHPISEILTSKPTQHSLSLWIYLKECNLYCSTRSNKLCPYYVLFFFYLIQCKLVWCVVICILMWPHLYHRFMQNQFQAVKNKKKGN